MKQWKLWTILASLTALTGCVSLTLPQKASQHFQTQSPKVRQRQLKELHQFTATGAFSIQEAGKKPVLANYQWSQKAVRFYRIRIYSPLNLFDMTILGQLGSVTLWKSTKERVTAPTAEQLLRKELGWNLPIGDLIYWIRGAIASGPHQVRFDRYGHVIELRQDGWVIKYSHYVRVGRYDLPQKLLLSRPNVRVTLVIKNWSLTSKSR